MRLVDIGRPAPPVRRIVLLALLLLSPASVFAGAGDVDWQRVAGEVEIRRDLYGIPHILGNDERAAAFGFGYAQGEDHMVEIARRILRARGEGARHFGPAEVDSDFAMRQFDNVSEAALALERVTPQFRSIVEAYAQGLNYYASRHRKRLPGWVPEISAVDVMALIRSHSVATIASPRIVAQLERKYAGRETDAGGGVEGPGSNAFAVSGEITDGGAPLLLANPHLNWSSLYWEAQVTVPGVVDFFGNTLAGYPVLWAGFNDRLGWANTVNAADLDDLYALRLDPAHPDHYRYEGRLRRLEYREFEVQVRREDGSLGSERRGFWYSHLGPVVHRRKDYAFSVRSERLQAPVQFEGFYRLSHARSLEEFRGVFDRYPVFSCNFIYADVDGNILYRWHAMLPKRPDDGTDYSLDVPADDSRYVWTQLHRADEMPELINPPGGVVQNANNPPWWASPDDWIDATAFPAYYERGPLALRPQLALDLLGKRKRYSIDEVLAVKFSTRMLLAERVLPDLLHALRARSDRSDALDSALRILQQWDGRVAGGSRGAVLFERFWEAYSADVAQPHAQPWSESEPTRTPRGLSDPDAALRHLEAAVAWVEERYGRADVAWGDVNRLRTRGLDLPGDGADGKYGTFRVMRYAEASDGKRMIGVESADEPPVGFGDNWIMLVEFSQPVRAWSVLGSGQSGDWRSPHRADQLGIFQSHQLRPVWYSAAEIEANLSRRYRPADAPPME